MHNLDPQSTSYLVKVGHKEVLVSGRTSEEAISQARRKLALELPRLYDVICALGAEQFEVRRTG